MKLANPKDYIRSAARRHPEKTAIVAEHGAVSYGALDGLIQRLRCELKASGVGRGCTVALVAHNSLEFVAAFYGILQAGGIVFPLSPKLAEGELAGLLAEAGADCVIYTKDLSQRLPVFRSAGARMALQLDIVAGDLLLERIASNQSGRAAAAVCGPTPRGVAARHYSSGSTGAPKHMLKTARNLSHDAWHFSTALGLTEEEVFLGVAPFCHAYGVLNVLASGLLGATLVVAKQFLPHPLLEQIIHNKATICLATPVMLEILADCHLEEIPRLESLRYCISSTAPLTQAVYQRFRQRFSVPVFQQYGSTETASIAICRLGDFSDETLVGTPMPGVRVQVFDQSFKRLHKGQVGRVGIKSPSACDCYVNNPDASLRTFQNGYVFPGDIGYLDDEGALHIVGRDNVVNVGGLKVDIIEVERVLNSHPKVVESLVYASTDGRPPLLRAAVVRRDQGLTVGGILDHCRTRLSDYKVPKLVRFVEKLPRDENGKVLRSRIEDHVARSGSV